MDKICRKCQRAAAGQYCTHCGEKLVFGDIYCDQCGNTYYPWERFCANCGSRLGQSFLAGLLKSFMGAFARFASMFGLQHETKEEVQ